MSMNLAEEVYFDNANGVYRWKSNDRIPPADVVFLDTLPKFNQERMNSLRAQETAAFLAEYREAMKNHVPSAEEQFEMRAAFGPGETVVNVITGQRYHT